MHSSLHSDTNRRSHTGRVVVGSAAAFIAGLPGQHSLGTGMDREACVCSSVHWAVRAPGCASLCSTRVSLCTPDLSPWHPPMHIYAVQVVSAFVYYGLVQLLSVTEFVAGEEKQCHGGRLTIPVSLEWQDTGQAGLDPRHGMSGGLGGELLTSKWPVHKAATTYQSFLPLPMALLSLQLWACLCVVSQTQEGCAGAWAMNGALGANCQGFVLG